jgi:hypothetical protein
MIKENELEVVSITLNGEKFNAETYSSNDNMDAVVIYKGKYLVNLRISKINGFADSFYYNIISDERQFSDSFRKWLDTLDDDYSPREYVIAKYQEYLYPLFVKDNEIVDFTCMTYWVHNILAEDEQVTIIEPCDELRQYIIVKRNDIGVSVDYYSDLNSSPSNTRQFYFDDYVFDTE